MLKISVIIVLKKAPLRVIYPLMSFGFSLIIKDSKIKVLRLNNTVICGDLITERFSHKIGKETRWNLLAPYNLRRHTKKGKCSKL